MEAGHMYENHRQSSGAVGEGFPNAHDDFDREEALGPQKKLVKIMTINQQKEANCKKLSE
jgi:hypothetical protein